VRFTCCFILYYNNYSGCHFMQIYGLATHYRLDGPGFKPQWGQDFPYPSWSAPRPNQSPVQWVTGVSPSGKAAGLWQWPPNPSKCQSWVRVKLYLYLPFVPSWHVMEQLYLLRNMVPHLMMQCDEIIQSYSLCVGASLISAVINSFPLRIFMMHD